MNHQINNEVLFNPNTGAMKEGIGHYGFERMGDRMVRMVCDNPYPCDFDRGIITNTVRVFSDDKNRFPRIEHDHSCRKNGDNACNYIVQWN